MRRVRKRTAGVLAALSLALTGCVGPAPSTPSPSPSPTFMCTPEAGGSEAPCSEQQFQEMKAKDALYAEAEQVYRTYQAEYAKVLRRGGSTKLTPGLEAVIGSTELKKVVVGTLINFKSEGLRIVGPGAQIRTVTRRPSLVKKDSLATVQFCLDSQDTATYRGSRKVYAGNVGTETAYFKNFSGGLRIIYIEGKRVQSC